MRKSFFLIFIILYQLSYSQIFSKETILRSGPDESRVNLVILSDGYKSNELNKFIADATNFSNELFKETPYKEYKNFFNVHLLKVPSKESGASHPGTATDVTEPEHPVKTVDNYFDSSFDGWKIHRLLVANDSKVFTVLANNFPTYDLALVLVNSPYYGGSGGPIAVSSTNVNANQVAIHELGHSFVKLIDEYYAGDIYAEEGINMTKNTNPNTVKWNNWINQNGIGIYQHCCNTESKKWYRPHQNCKMRYLGEPFCSVCTEATIEKIHSLTELVDSYTPKNTGAIDISSPITFNINSVFPIPNTLNIEWSLNGAIINNKDFSISISQKDLTSGNNKLQAVIKDVTPLLKVNNHENIHFNSIIWNINSTTFSIDEISSEKLAIKLYPTPVQDALHFDLAQKTNDNYNITISDATGKQFIDKQINHLMKQTNINLKTLPSGVYFINFKFKSGLKISKKIIKK